MTKRTRIGRFVHQVTLLAGMLFGTILIIVLIEELIGGRKDAGALTAANVATAAYQQQFVIGKPMAAIETALRASNAATIHRGDDVLIGVQEGRQLWYCSRNYFGTAMRFQEGKLQQIATEQWPETCL